MKRIKRLGALIVSFAIALSIIVPASAVSTNDSTVFLKQNTGSTCTLSAAAMMLRRRAILDGSSNWSSITESNLKPTAWVTGQGARFNYTYNGVSVTTKSLKNFSGDKKEYFISMLSAHPEGIVVYNHSKPHAVLLTDYDATTDTFYCADPSTAAPNGRIKFLNSRIPGDTQDSKIANISQIWYIKSGKTISPITVKTSQSGHWAVSVPSHYKLFCYSSADAAKNSTYIKAQSERYVLSCTKLAILSNGKTRYFFVSVDKKSLWFDYDANYMSVTESPGETSHKQYTVYFDPNGGVVSQTSKTVAAGSIVGSMPTPTREGYTFLGWSTSKNTSGLLLRTGDEMVVEKDTTLYAEWKEISKTYTVNFNGNGGIVSTNYKQVTVGKPYGTLPTPVRNGYTFDGWYTALHGGSQITSSSIATENQMLYAHWQEIKQTHTVYFNPSGGYIEDIWEKTVTDGENYGQLPVPYYKGYSFAGWWTERDGNGIQRTSDSIVNLSSSETLYAKWVQSDIKVSYNPNGGYCKKSYSFYKPSGLYNDLPMPERLGYNFLGWYTKQSGGEKVQSNMTLMQDNDHTLYAHWEKVQETPIQSSLKIEGLRVDVSSDGFTPQYTITSNYSLDGATTEITGLMDDDYFEMGSISLNPDMDIYELTGGHIYKNRDRMVSGHTYRFEITVKDISGATATASTTFTLP